MMLFLFCTALQHWCDVKYLFFFFSAIHPPSLRGKRYNGALIQTSIIWLQTTISWTTTMKLYFCCCFCCCWWPFPSLPLFWCGTIWGGGASIHPLPRQPDSINGHQWTIRELLWKKEVGGGRWAAPSLHPIFDKWLQLSTLFFRSPSSDCIYWHPSCFATQFCYINAQQEQTLVGQGLTGQLGVTSSCGWLDSLSCPKQVTGAPAGMVMKRGN